MSELLHTVATVFSTEGYLAVQDKSHYNIPDYQRGYKWAPKHVVKLLDDIHQFDLSDDTFYCLQNITLVPDPEAEAFNVVDGQQRLSTLTLLLHYLGESEMVQQKVQFPRHSIRESTNTFLNDLLTTSTFDLAAHNWASFIGEYPDYDHQDIYYLFQAYITIDDWFKNKQETRGFDKEAYKDKLLHHVKFIVNNVSDSTGEEKIFGNLNSKRIPLDGADLIRAALVTRVAEEESRRETDVRKIVLVNERRIKIGWVVDQMSNWWSQPKVAAYFQKMIHIPSEMVGSTALFDKRKHPINQLYLLYAEAQGEKELTLAFIEKQNNAATSLYKALLKLHHTLQDWFQDRTIYHLLGYLFFQGNSSKSKALSFREAWEIWNTSSTREAFVEKLLKKTRATLEQNDERIDFTDINENWYSQHPTLLLRSLILMDVIHASKNNRAFMPPAGFSKTNNDIEHIFPQRPKEPADKKAYIEFLNEHVVPNGESHFDTTHFSTQLTDKDYLQEVDQFIAQHTRDIKTHSLGNLVLLYSSLNRSLKNATYAIKRARIITHFNEGHYIQPHTFHVFVRYFNNEAGENHDLQHWTNQDIKANTEAIATSIHEFLNPR